MAHNCLQLQLQVSQHPLLVSTGTRTHIAYTHTDTYTEMNWAWSFEWVTLWQVEIVGSPELSGHQPSSRFNERSYVKGIAEQHVRYPSHVCQVHSSRHLHIYHTYTHTCADTKTKNTEKWILNNFKWRHRKFISQIKSILRKFLFEELWELKKANVIEAESTGY